MNETNSQWQPTGLERFGHLEDKIFRLVEEFKDIRKENEILRAENKELKAEVEALNAEESTAHNDLAQLQKEREELRERVEKALNLLETLDVR